LQETGARELTGEWVVGNDVWRRLKAERRARWHAELRRRTPHGPSRLREAIVGDDDALNSVSSTPPRVSRRHNSNSSSGPGDRETGRDTPEPELEGESAVITSHRERVIYYVHGGAYYVGNAATHRLVTIGVSKACNARVFAITYRLAPEATFPLPLLDVLQGYLRLLAPPLSIPPENIIVIGDSAGGGLSLAMCMYLRDNGYQLPSGLVLMSPWVDLTMSCGSWDDNGDMDVIPLPEADDHLNPVGCYLGPKGIATYLTHPYASPLFGDLAGLPPMLIQSGDAEVLRDENTLLAHKATLAGVSVTHELYEDMVHVFQMFTWLPATHAAINSIGRWVRQTLPRIEWEQRQMAEMEAAAAEEDQWYGEHNRLEDEDTTPTATGSPALPSVLGLERVPTTPRVHAPHIDLDSLPPVSTFLQPPSTEDESPFRPELVHAQLADAELADDDHEYDPVLHLSRPSMRRANTMGHRTVESSPSAQTATLGSPRAAFRRRRTTVNLQMHMSSPVSPTGGTSRAVSPVSPTPSVRRRFRAPTIGSHPTTPSARSRSHSHTDIFQLVEGYVEDGAANATVVYTPGGEIRSVGVLGNESDAD
jgi:acetyl esterase/lipase